jgi:hypothetical protein
VYTTVSTFRLAKTKCEMRSEPRIVLNSPWSTGIGGPAEVAADAMARRLGGLD